MVEVDDDTSTPNDVGETTMESFDNNNTTETGAEPEQNTEGELVPTDDNVAHKEPPTWSDLDVRVGVVHMLSRHPNPGRSKLRFTETIHYGYEGEEGQEKQEVEDEVESGVPKYYEYHHIHGPDRIVLCNIKPITKRGLKSKIVVLCARKGSKIDFLQAPDDSKAGDHVMVKGYERTPRLPFVNDVFKHVGPDLWVNHDRQVTYRGVPLEVKDRGFVTTNKLRNCPVSNVMGYSDI